jgi:hypothetical protein
VRRTCISSLHAPLVAIEDVAEPAADVDVGAVEELKRQAADSACHLVARTTRRTPARVDAQIELSVDPRRLDFFDFETGKRLLHR